MGLDSQKPVASLHNWRQGTVVSRSSLLRLILLSGRLLLLFTCVAVPMTTTTTVGAMLITASTYMSCMLSMTMSAMHQQVH